MKNRVWLLFLLVPVIMWWISFILLPRTPGDAIFSLGPALGLMRESRLVDFLVWDNFPVYFGHPPVYFLYEIGLLSLFGFKLSSIYLIIFSLLIIYGVSLHSLLSKFTNNKFQIGIVILLTLCSNYLVSGRVDILAVIFLTLMVLSALRTTENPTYKSSLFSGVFMALSFLTHPLAGALASVIFTLLYFIYTPQKKFIYYFITGSTAFVIVFSFYLPYVYLNFETFSEHFVSMAVGQKHFYATNLFKYIAYNLGFFGFLGWIIFRTKWSGAPGRIKKWLIISLASILIIFFFGMSYYYLYCQPVFCILIIVLWKELSESVRQPLVYKIIMGCLILVSLFQGPISIILQTVRRPEYAEHLIKFRAGFKDVIKQYPDYKIIADGNLIVEDLANPKARYFWHSFDHYRSSDYLNQPLIFAFTEQKLWDENLKLVGNWRDTTRYEILSFQKGAAGLPSSYFLNPRSDSLTLVILKTRHR